jgi:hypothetical protein
MELVTPGLFPIITTLLSLTNILLLAIALYYLLTSKSETTKRDFLWLLAIVFFPVFGSAYYLVYRRK